MEKNGRLTYLDMVKGIAIILVVIGHSTVASDGVFTWITSFHMPLFFIVSGILFYLKKSQTTKFKDYILKRFQGLMIPYFIFSVVYIVVFYIYSARLPEVYNAEFIRDAYLQAVSFYGISVLWFLPTLFFGELVFYGIAKKFPGWLIVPVLLVFAIIPPFAFNAVNTQVSDAGVFMHFIRFLLFGIIRIPEAVAFMGIGYGVRFLYDKFCGKVGTVKWWIEVPAGIGLMIIHAVAAFSNQQVDMRYIIQGNPLLFHVAACSATFGLLLICKHLPKLWLLSVLGANSLIVMLTHLDCQVLCVGLWFASKMKKYVTHENEILYLFNLFAFMLVAELVLIFVINKWFYFLIGKKRPVKTELPSWVKRFKKDN